MSYDVLDQQKTRALELSRQWDPEVLRPQYEAVLAGCRPVALAPRSLEIVSIYERGIRKLLHGDTALLSERTSDRHQSFLGECLKVCFALPDFSGIYASGDVSQHMRNETRYRVRLPVQSIADLFGILSRHPSKILIHQYDHLVLLGSQPVASYQSEPVTEASASSNVWPLLELVGAETEAHTTEVIKIIFVG